MQASTATIARQQLVSCQTVARPTSRRTRTVQANARPQATSRRSAALLMGVMPALLAVSAFARDADKAKAAAEARKEQLAKAAEEMRESGKTASAFSDSQYAVSEDKSPNVHTRQEEGVRESAD